MCVMEGARRSEDSLEQLNLFSFMGPGDGAQIVRFGSHLDSPQSLFKEEDKSSGKKKEVERGLKHCLSSRKAW